MHNTCKHTYICTYIFRFTQVNVFTYSNVCMYVVVRICNEDVSLCEHDLAKGSTIMVHMQGVHHNPNLWPEPLKYRPDR